MFGCVAVVDRSYPCPTMAKSGSRCGQRKEKKKKFVMNHECFHLQIVLKKISDKDYAVLVFDKLKTHMGFFGIP
jgi:hypothetical protein